MPLLATAASVIIRRGGSQAVSALSRRGISCSVFRNAASQFSMPALSPTMTEGSITKWRVKEGDSFSAGDILLDIETDKAQMDVEAQDDGKMAKIIVHDGEKNIQVGAPIAIIAEPEDDLSSLELPDIKTPQPEKPKEESSSKPAPSSSPDSSGPKKEEKKETTTPVARREAPKSAVKADPNQVLFPSVLNLLGANDLSIEDALDKIPASGPKGRILKGDALTYFGKIPASAVESLNEEIKKLQKLDLSKIKIAKSESGAGGSKEATKEIKIQDEPQIYEFDTTEEPLDRLTVSNALKLAYQNTVERRRVKSFKTQQDELFADLVAPPIGSKILNYSFEVTNRFIPISGNQNPPLRQDSLFNEIILSNATTSFTNSNRGKQIPQASIKITVWPNKKAGATDNDAKFFVDQVEEMMQPKPIHQQEAAATL